MRPFRIPPSQRGHSESGRRATAVSEMPARCVRLLARGGSHVKRCLPGLGTADTAVARDMIPSHDRSMSAAGDSRPRRGGTSLTEVLAAILIMGVGVLAVMTLFPISILRSIQATQLTNATILAKRADALIDTFGLVSDTYIPQPNEGRVTHAIIDPIGWNDYATDIGGGLVPWLYGNTGGPTPTATGYLPAGLVSQPPPSRDELNAKWPVFKNPYVINAAGDKRTGDVRTLTDPSGGLPGVPLRRISYGPLAASGGGQPYGNDSLTAGPGPPGPYPLAPSLFSSALGPTALRDAFLRTVSLPDHYDTAFVGDPDVTQITATSVVFPGGQYDLSNLVTANLVPGTRATFIELNGNRSQVRSLADGLIVAAIGTPPNQDWQISWSAPLPADFLAISEVRIEIPQWRYTWMLTVRKRGNAGGSVSEIDCVVFFNRPLGDANQELLHSAVTTTGNDEATDEIDITFSAGVTPPIKKGGWIFDPQNALWYRVIDVLTETTMGARVQLDRLTEQPLSWVTIPEGVINVFPLRSRVDQKRLGGARRENG